MTNRHKLADFLESFKKEAFLQSEGWRVFQESVGRKTFHVEDVSKAKNGSGKFCIWANIIIHNLPLVGDYFYVPRGPVMTGEKNFNLFRIEDVKKTLDYIFWLAKDNEAGWIRFDPRSEKDLILIREAIAKIDKKEHKTIVVQKAPHDVQPKEIFVMDISDDDEKLLSRMKSKTRYNVRLAEKRGVVVKKLSSKEEKRQGVEEFLKLNRETALRDGIVTHPDEYYRKMVEALPDDMLDIYTAEYEGKTIVVNMVMTLGDTATYAHGASSDSHRDVMAPYLLQWRQILDAKGRKCRYYDFGGVKTDRGPGKNSWEGITRFKLGFSPKTLPIVFPGSYDIIINPRKYAMYRGIQRAKVLLKKLRK